jgi:predicted lipid-binding transport protein (Tim44 family)
MGDSSQYLYIIVLAGIAGFFWFRLRSVLGRRTGSERPRGRPVTPPNEPSPERAAPLPPLTRPMPAAQGASAVARLKSADRSFDEAAFLKGARGAFEIIVNAFAKGDTAALQPLLSESVYRSFAEAIQARTAARETLETNLLSIKSVELVASAIEGETAFVTVKFVSDQTHATRGADGTVVDGDPNQVSEKTDLWTFARALQSRDPNWTLVATNS